MRAGKMKSSKGKSEPTEGSKLILPFAKKKKADALSADGKAARPRLDRPGRKMRADGGPTISQDSKDEARKLSLEAVGEIGKGAAKGLPGAALLGTGIGGYLGHMKSIRPPGPIGKAIWGTMTAAGAGLAADAAMKGGDAASAKAQEATRIRKGLVKDGEEDRKAGGRVKKR